MWWADLPLALVAARQRIFFHHAEELGIVIHRHPAERAIWCLHSCAVQREERLERLRIPGACPLDSTEEVRKGVRMQMNSHPPVQVFRYKSL
jgi:hypothetical protein